MLSMHKILNNTLNQVGIGPNGKTSALARCCLVDFDGKGITHSFSS